MGCCNEAGQQDLSGCGAGQMIELRFTTIERVKQKFMQDTVYKDKVPRKQKKRNKKVVIFGMVQGGNSKTIVVDWRQMKIPRIIKMDYSNIEYAREANKRSKWFKKQIKKQI